MPSRLFPTNQDNELYNYKVSVFFSTLDNGKHTDS